MFILLEAHKHSAEKQSRNNAADDVEIVLRGRRGKKSNR